MSNKQYTVPFSSTPGSGGGSSSNTFNVSTAGLNAPTPVYATNEAPSNMSPFGYVQDENGFWHQQLGVDTNIYTAGPNPPAGTLTWTRRMFFRDNAASTQTFKNAFLAVNHAAGSGTFQGNQDRGIGVAMSNFTGAITHYSISNNVITFTCSTTSFNGSTIVPFVAGQLVNPKGLSVGTTLNNGQFTVQSGATTSSVSVVPCPYALFSADNAAGGSTIYNGTINGGASNGLAGATFVIANFNTSANNGTFLCTASSPTTLTLSNASGVAESNTAATATGTYTNASLTADTGTLDQYLYAMEGIQCELDIYGAPTITGSPDGEVSAGSFQCAVNLASAVTAPPLLFTSIRAQTSRSGVGYATGGGGIPFVGVYALAVQNNAANIDSAGMAAFLGSYGDQSAGAPNGIGYGLAINPGGSNRYTSINKSIYTGATGYYPLTSVANAGGGSTVYTGSNITAAANSLVGQTFAISGFSGAGNNGSFACTANTAGANATLTLTNPNGTAETHAAKAYSLRDYALYLTDGQVYIGGNIAFYNGLATAGNGIPSEVNQIAATGLTANYNAGSAKTIFTPTAASQLRISFSQAITTADAVSSTFPSLTLGWTDVGGIARTKTLVATSSTNTTAVESDGVAVITTNTSTPVTVTSAGYASNTPSTMTYALSVTCEVL